VWQLGRGFRFVAAVASAGFCAAIAVPDHMTYESCDESVMDCWWVGFVAAVAVADFIVAVAGFI